MLHIDIHLRNLIPFVMADSNIYVRFSIALVSIFASILKPSSSVQLLFTWHSFGSWETKERPGTTAIAWRLEAMDVNLLLRGVQEALEIAIRK